jgi:hypothetical protein
MATQFYGLKFKRCRKHKMNYIFCCPRCFDPEWETPILLRVAPDEE